MQEMVVEDADVESLAAVSQFDMTVANSEGDLHSVSIKFSFEPRFFVCQAPGALIRVSTCGVLHDTFWFHFGSILGPFWVHVGSIWGTWFGV